MKFATWLRSLIDELVNTPKMRALQSCMEWERANFDARLEETGTFYEARLKQETERRVQERTDLTERIRDKDAQINDLRGRLAVAEGDAMREKLERAKSSTPKPVPDFGGPVSFQDELRDLPLEVVPTEEEAPKGE